MPTAISSPDEEAFANALLDSVRDLSKLHGIEPSETIRISLLVLGGIAGNWSNNQNHEEFFAAVNATFRAGFEIAALNGADTVGHA